MNRMCVAALCALLAGFSHASPMVAQDRPPRVEWGVDKAIIGTLTDSDGRLSSPTTIRFRWGGSPEGPFSLEQRMLLNDRRRGVATGSGGTSAGLNLVLQRAPLPSVPRYLRPFFTAGILLSEGRPVGSDDSEMLWGVTGGYGIKRPVGQSAVRFESSLRYDAAGRARDDDSRIPSRLRAVVSIGMSGFW